MQSNLEFRSAALLDAPAGDAPMGEKLARLLGAQLPARGFAVADVFPEDWGWCVRLENAGFPLWIGCGQYPEFPDGHLCFIEPSRPFVRRWFRRIATGDTVERLADVIEAVVVDSGLATDVRWWTEAENARG